MKKNICFVNGDFSLGGIQKVNTYLSESLASEGQVVYLYKSIPNSTNFYKFEKSKMYTETYNFGEIINKNCWRIIRKIKKIIGSEFHFRARDIEIKKLIKFLKHMDIDTVILNGPIFISYIPFIKRVIPGIKCIGWIHNSHKIYLGEDSNSYTKFYRKAFTDGLAAADKNVCLTNEDLLVYKKFNQKTICIYNPLTMNIIGEANLDKKNIAFLSRIAIQHKGLDYLAEIASEIPKEWKIRFGGSGSDKDLNDFNQNIKKFGSEDTIDLLGALNENEIKKLFEDSSIYLMTSRWEGMPLVLAEAMSFGLPIIAFDQTGSREVLDNGKYGILVEQGNINEMDRQLKRLINDKHLREMYSQKSLERIKDFDIKTVTKKWLEII